MDFLMNNNELEALSGLLHFHQLTYLRGIRPYMDVQTGIVGIKRGISYQSIAEQLFVEPHQGIQNTSYSRAQIRRAISSLERAGLICVQSEKYKLILKCPLASMGYFVQNKPVTKPSDQPVTFETKQIIENTRVLRGSEEKPDIVKTVKAVLPLISNNNYIYLLKHFEQFWELYPLKNSKPKAWQVFQELNPSEQLITQIFDALKSQLHHVQKQQALGQWVPNWKNPANWLLQRCWDDVVTTEQQETNYAKNNLNTRKQQAADPLWDSCKPCDEESDSNVICFSKGRRKHEAN